MSPKITTMKQPDDGEPKAAFTCPGCKKEIMNGEPCYNKTVTFMEKAGNGESVECTTQEVWCMDCKGKELEASSKDD